MIRFVANEKTPGEVRLDDFGIDVAESVAAWHASFPEYDPTPLVNLSALADELGVASFHVKDESPRFGLNAFKVLGGSYAVGRCIAERLGKDISELPCDAITCDEVRAHIAGLTFATATDGNHGRGVAWAARRLGCNSVVYMPKGTVAERLENIRTLGADAKIVDLAYDDTVRLIAAEAAEKGWTVVQDTTSSTYRVVPQWIMQGYTTMGAEMVRQLEAEPPTHLFLQAGVGSMAAAMAAFFASYYRDNCPKIIVVEPDEADCFYRTASAADGNLHVADGDLDTIMAGLACGEPCDIAWDILHATAHGFVSMPDWVAAEGMRVLAHPYGNDAAIVSGESGASGTGLAIEVLRNPSLSGLREQMGLGPDSRVLCISTEGATDCENYRRIVEEGVYPRPE